MLNNDLNFGWVIEGQLAGCAKPYLNEDLTYLYEKGIRAIVRLEEGGFESEDIINLGIEDFPEYIPDYTAPSQIQIDKIINFIKSHLDKGEPVAVSCGAGIGRTGTILTAYHISEGYSFHDAELLIKREGRKPYETPGQKKALEEYASRLMVIE
jgi:atypical dual specificity phosphatase